MRCLARLIFAMAALFLVSSLSAVYAQQIVPPMDQLRSSDCSDDLYYQAEKLYRLNGLDANAMVRAERLISKMIVTCPFADSDQNLKSELDALHEMRAEHNFLIAKYYFDRFEEGPSGFKGAQSRFIEITTKYPHFYKIYEVLLLLGETFVYDDDYESAETELKKLIDDFPLSPVRGSLEADLEMVRTNRSIPRVSPAPQALETTDEPSKP